MPSPLPNKVNANQSGVNGISSKPETNGTQSVASPEATQPNVIKSSKAGTISLGLGTVLTAGLAVGGLIAGFSSIPGIILLIAASVGATILVAALAIMHFGPKKEESTTNPADQWRCADSNAIDGNSVENGNDHDMITQERKREIAQLIKELCQETGDGSCYLDQNTLEKYCINANELQYILTNHGTDLYALDLSNWPFQLEKLDLSTCARLYRLNLANQCRLEQLTGLKECSVLTSLNLSNCAKIRKHDIMEAIPSLRYLRQLDIEDSSLLRDSQDSNPDHLTFEDYKVLGTYLQGAQLFVGYQTDKIVNSINKLYLSSYKDWTKIPHVWASPIDYNNNNKHYIKPTKKFTINKKKHWPIEYRL